MGGTASAFAKGFGGQVGGHVRAVPNSISERTGAPKPRSQNAVASEMRPYLTLRALAHEISRYCIRTTIDLA